MEIGDAIISKIIPRILKTLSKRSLEDRNDNHDNKIWTKNSINRTLTEDLFHFPVEIIRNGIILTQVRHLMSCILSKNHQSAEWLIELIAQSK